MNNASLKLIMNYESEQ